MTIKPHFCPLSGVHLTIKPSFSDNTEFTNEDGSDNLKETIEANYKCVKQDILTLVASEMERIKNDPNLKGLIKE